MSGLDLLPNIKGSADPRKCVYLQGPQTIYPLPLCLYVLLSLPSAALPIQTIRLKACLVPCVCSLFCIWPSSLCISGSGYYVCALGSTWVEHLRAFQVLGPHMEKSCRMCVHGGGEGSGHHFWTIFFHVLGSRDVLLFQTVVPKGKQHGFIQSRKKWNSGVRNFGVPSPHTLLNTWPTRHEIFTFLLKKDPWLENDITFSPNQDHFKFSGIWCIYQRNRNPETYILKYW